MNALECLLPLFLLIKWCQCGVDRNTTYLQHTRCKKKEFGEWRPMHKTGWMISFHILMFENLEDIIQVHFIEFNPSTFHW